MLLIRVEWKGTGRSLWIEPHALQRKDIRDWGDKHCSAVFEADEAAVEQVVCGRGEQEPVRAFETFFVRALSPRLDVAADQVCGVGDEGDSARMFQQRNALLDQKRMAGG